ncbi:MAG: TPM domain-containing protein [Chitinophagaceae bacterium]
MIKYNSKIHLLILVWLFGSIIQTTKVYAQLPTTTYHSVIPNVPNPPRLINDLANMLSDFEEESLEKKVLDFEKESSNEISVVTVDTLGGLEVSQFANELGRKWNIGKASKKNGVLLLISKKDRKINISPGYGLSGVLTDVICGRIIRNHITPNFKQGNFYLGIDEAVDALIAGSKGEFTNDEYQSEEAGSLLPIVFLLLFMFFFFFLFYKMRNHRNIYVSRRGYKYDETGWGSLPRSGTGWFTSGGWGDNDGGGGGGFGGFGGGGGGFDGGGASGSW